MLSADHSPSNSDMDYRIFNMGMLSFCTCIHMKGGGGRVYCLIQRTFVELAHNSTPEKPQDGHKA